MDKIRIPERDIPIVRSSDVVVVGGGPGGISAAIAAARTGADTVLIERYGFLGGMITAGLMTSINGFRNERKPNHIQTVRGIGEELIARLHSEGGACGCTAHGNFEPIDIENLPYAVSVDPEIFKSIALEMLEEAGVNIMLHSFLYGAFCEGFKLSTALIAGKSGLKGVKGKIYIDASGDGDLAARAGAQFAKGDKKEGRMMAMSLMYRVANIPQPAPQENRLWINGLTTVWGPGVEGFDGSDQTELQSSGSGYWA